MKRSSSDFFRELSIVKSRPTVRSEVRLAVVLMIDNIILGAHLVTEATTQGL